jgi:opacity protein-like surface antigen
MITTPRSTVGSTLQRRLGVSPRGFIALLWLLGLSAAPSASAQFSYPEGMYGWYEAGPAVVETAKIRDFFGEFVTGNSVEFDTGFHFGIGIGRELTRFLSVEVESGFNYNAVKSIQDATASSANTYRIPVLGNLVLQFPNRTGIVPVIGGGVGAHWAVFDAQNVELGATALEGDSETWVFGYQGYAGLRYQFREDMSLGVFYHYSVADGPSWDFGSSFGGNFKLDSLRTHTLSLTFGWRF